MKFLRKALAKSPVHARFLPFFIFFAPLLIQDWFGHAASFWIYFIRTMAGAWCVYEMRSLVPEMRWTFSWEGVAVGVLVLVIWVALDPYYPPNHIIFKPGPQWNPFQEFGQNAALAWFFVAVRTIGTAIVVPPLEEVFYRSLIYRFLIKDAFERVPLNTLHWGSFIVTSLLFGLEHYQWLAGILCGFCYQFLVIKKGRLGDAMLAHGVTNFLLSIWVVWKGAWNFW
jgi:uncharacterized protein